jgi:hypothetical protein
MCVRHANSILHNNSKLLFNGSHADRFKSFCSSKERIGQGLNATSSIHMHTATATVLGRDMNMTDKTTTDRTAGIKSAAKFTTVILTAAVAASITAALVVKHPQTFDPIGNTRAQTAAAAVSTASGTPTPGILLPDFTALVEKNGSAVVNISTVQKVRTSAAVPGMPFQPGDPFYEFFRRFQGPGQGQGQPNAQPVMGVGS